MTLAAHKYVLHTVLLVFHFLNLVAMMLSVEPREPDSTS